MTPKKDPADQLPTADWAQAAAPAAAGDSQSPTASRLPSDEQPTLPQPPRSGIARDAGGDGRYVLLDEIASGAMGVVYLAEDRVVGRRVALKMIRAGVFAGAAEVERFTREARALARLSHPHIVQVYDFGESEGRPFFTMQLASGGTLAAHLQGFGADARVAVALVEKVARGVQHAHEQGILHRDLKPANVLLGAGDEPLVSDFGLVKFLHAEEQGLTQAGVMPGTAPYMAPEQAAGRAEEVGPRTDVWALGVILYELLVGRRPFEGKTREEILHRILTTSVPPMRSEIDVGVEAIVMKCLEKEPPRRYETAGTLAEDLARWLRGEYQPTLPGQPTSAPGNVGRTRLWALAGGAALILALTVGAGFFLGKPSTTGVPATTGTAVRPMKLIGDGKGLPEGHDWILGAKPERMEVTDEGFWLSADKAVAVQLLAAPPWPSYKLQAVVQQKASKQGSVGFFFGYIGYESDEGPHHLLFSAGIADRGAAQAQWVVDVSRIPDDKSKTTLALRCGSGQLQNDVPAGAGAPWRTLVVAVTPRDIKVACDNQTVFSSSAERLWRPGAGLFIGAKDLNRTVVPHGGIGLYLDKDNTATFRKVTVEPLEEGP